MTDVRLSTPPLSLFLMRLEHQGKWKIVEQELGYRA